MHESNSQKTDFQLDRESVTGSKPNLTLDLAYKISPIMQLHLKRAWITGLAIDPESLAQEAHTLDPRVPVSEALRFLKDHITNPEWEKAREDALTSAYQKMLADGEKVRELIDQRYDFHFHKIQLICAQQIEQIELISRSQIIGNKLASQVRAYSGILKDCYLMQRLARGMSQGKFTHEVIHENAEFEQTLKQLQERLSENIIEVQARVLPSV